MAVKIGINGFGRIGRLTLRAMLEKYRGQFDVVGVNDLTDAATNAHLFKYDTTYGIYQGDVSAGDGTIKIDGDQIRIFAEKDPANIPWGNLGAEIVVEGTGAFTDAEKAKAHLTAGAKRVIITAPAKNEDVTIVLGVNEDMYKAAEHRIVSNASCTTNCLAPVCKVLQDRFGIEKGFMTTIHAYTNDQRIQDQAHKDLRRARAAAASIIPTTTGAAKAVSLVMPELKGKMHGYAMRVPTLTVSAVDLVVQVGRSVTADEVNQAFREAANGRLKGILGVCDEELVSSDFRGDSRSSIVDSAYTMVMQENMVKVLAWYDNEWGYSCRVADLAKMMAG